MKKKETLTQQIYGTVNYTSTVRKTRAIGLVLLGIGRQADGQTDRQTNTIKYV